MLIKVDIDGVLRDFVGSVYNHLYSIMPQDVPENEPLITKWDIHEFYPKIRKDEFYRLIFYTYGYEIFSFAKPYPDAWDFMMVLRNLGVTIVLFTQQTLSNATHTLRWLKKYSIPFDYFIFTETKDKRLMPGLLLDDKPENMFSGADILLDRPWNQDFTWANRAMNLEDAAMKISKLVKRTA
jgi:5'(3')-deoxyribonucleotidase